MEIRGLQEIADCISERMEGDSPDYRAIAKDAMFALYELIDVARAENGDPDALARIETKMWADYRERKAAPKRN